MRANETRRGKRGKGNGARRRQLARNPKMVCFYASGKDVFGCRKQLKADGFNWNEQTRRWIGTEGAVEKFKARGFRVKVFFAKLAEVESHL